jgi:hypothetical protein
MSKRKFSRSLQLLAGLFLIACGDAPPDSAISMAVQTSGAAPSRTAEQASSDGVPDAAKRCPVGEIRDASGQCRIVCMVDADCPKGEICYLDPETGEGLCFAK